ncbi:MAG: CoA transferase, partial [Rhodospirillaceae bacterium]|nr:CoA transferase [Rhodospirillaceae bacterium]
DELAALRMESDSGYGPIRHLGPLLGLSETAPGWSRPSPALGSNSAEWLT